MKFHVFVSTAMTQGQRKGDFCSLPEGVLVQFPQVTPHRHHTDDARCLCKRAMAGSTCNGITTTMRVVEMKWWQLLLNYGRLGNNVPQYLFAASMFKPGNIVEYRDGAFSLREMHKMQRSRKRP
jgi:hypothetical protein